MSLVATDLRDAIITKFDELGRNLNPDSLPDFLHEMSEIITQYITDNAEVLIAWTAISATTPPTPDASGAANPPTLKLSGVNISFSKSECSEFKDCNTSPKLIKELFSGKISVAMGTVIAEYTATGVEIWNVTSLPLATADPTYTSKLYTPNSVYSFDFGSGMKTEDGKQVQKDYRENMLTFCENLISKITSFSPTGISILPTSTHIVGGVTYTSTTSTLVRIL